MRSTEHFARVRALFDELSERPPEERGQALEASEEASAVKQEVRRLLDVDALEHPWLDAPIRRPKTRLQSDQHVGPYRIIRLIDEGGMGAVFLARRERDFDQEVAVKVIHRWSAGSEAVRRFEVERQILASLRHPNIAQLLDGGVTEDGQPYFTMEYVEGVPITEYCRKEQLGVEARLRLFMTVCEAVRHAQQNLVVHRDLKPQNILVTQAGVVKLLDFGIAKILDAAETAHPMTRTGARILTPGYCAPEQLRGEPVTTATDVFALGVVLFELLVGRSPHRGDSIAEIEASVLSEVTTAPSAVAETGDSAVLRSDLRGDLDTICTTALRRNPTERYGTAADLLADIQLHLEGRPIRARPPSFGYRFGKFVRRNAFPVVVALLMLLGVGIQTSFYTLRLQDERDRARFEAEKAAAVARFVTGLFRASDPRVALGEEITARELLARGESRVRETFRGQPLVRAAMLETMGRARRGLGDFEAAEVQLEEALALRAEHLSSEAPEVDRGRLALAEVLTDQAEYAEAERLFETLLEGRAERHGEDAVATIEARQAFGSMLTEAGRFEDAAPHLEAAVARWRELNDEERLGVALTALGLLLHERNDYAACELAYREALELLDRRKGPVHPDIALLNYRLSQLLRDQARYEEAVPLHHATLEMDRAIYGDEHPVVADDMTNLGFLLVELNEYDAATRMIEAALDMRRRILKPDHPDFGRSITRLAHLEQQLGRYERAEVLYREAYEVQLKSLGPEHPLMAGRMNNLSWVLFDLEQYEAALEWAERGLALNLEKREAGSMSVAISRMHAARALRALRRPREAAAMIEGSLDTGLRLYAPDHPFAASCRRILAQVLLDLGDLDRADAQLQMAADALGKIFEDDHLRIAAVRETWGQVRWAQGRREEARRLWKAALGARRAALSPDHPLIVKLKTLIRQTI